MDFSKEDKYNVSDLGNWNVASDFSRIKIMKPLDYCDHYENIARFGYDTLIEQLEYFGVPIDSLKLIGFERLVTELLKLCGNAKFAMKVGGTRKELEDLEEELIKIEKIIPVLSKTIKKQKKQKLVLDTEKYNTTLNLVIKIKAKLNEPLNKNHLIFTDKQEFDPQAYKEQIMDAARKRG